MDFKTVTDTSKAWLVNIKVDDRPVKFKIDTGAAVTALPTYLMYSCKGVEEGGVTTFYKNFEGNG